MSDFWKDKNVLVTGGAGFIGSHVVEKLLKKRAKVTVLDNLQNGNLNNLAQAKGKLTFIKGDCTDRKTAEKACRGQGIVMNLAARVGGIEYNRTHQAIMLEDNLLIGAVMLEAAKKAHVDRFLVVSSACVYPHNCKVPTPESEGFVDIPEPTNEGYGWAKRMNEKLGMFYANEFNMKVGIVRPYNCYGPRDHFDPDTSHVISALIKRVIDRENPVVVWGDGNQTRAFLYVEDLADLLIAAIEKYPVPDPVNLGTNEEVSIKDLVKKILKISGSNSKITFDKSKPNGSPRRNSDNTKAEKKLKMTTRINLDEGLKRTIEWYKENKHEKNN